MGNGRHASGVVLVFFRGPEWWRRVRRPHTEVVAVDTATAATHRWRAVRAVEGSDRWGDGRHGVVFVFFRCGCWGSGARGVLREVSDWGAAREDDELMNEGNQGW